MAKAPKSLRREGMVKFEPQSQLLLHNSISRLRCTLPSPPRVSRSTTMAGASISHTDEDDDFVMTKIEIPYKLNMKNQTGFLCDSLLPVIFRLCRHSEDSRGMLFNHLNNLPCLLILKAIGQKKDDDMVIYRRPEQGCREYFLNLNLHPVETCSVYGKQASFIPEEYRFTVKGIIDCTIALQSSGYSFATEQLTLFRNLAFDGGHAVLFDYQTRPMNKSSKKADYILIANLIDEILERCDDVPCEMSKLVSKMRHYEEGDEQLYARHIAVLSHKERVTFFKDCSEFESFFETQGQLDQYENALRQMFPAHKWIGLVEDGSFYPLEDFYCSSRRRVNRARYIDNPEYHTDFEINKCLIHFTRNFCVHCGDNFAKASEQYDYKLIEIMIMTKFGIFLVSFQEELHAQKILKLI